MACRQVGTRADGAEVTRVSQEGRAEHGKAAGTHAVSADLLSAGEILSTHL